MAAVITLVVFRIEHHFVMADRADYAGTRAHVPALQAVVEPTVFVDIKKYIAAAFRAAFCFPLRHLLLHFNPGGNGRQGDNNLFETSS